MTNKKTGGDIMSTDIPDSLKGEVPLGFGIALAQDLAALNAFSALDNTRKQQIIENAGNIQSKEEMQIYVDSLSKELF